MTWMLIRHHPAMRSSNVKWSVAVLVSITLWFGILANRVEAGQTALNWPLLAAAWLVPAIYLAFGPHVSRARAFALTLPIPAGRVWAAHVIVVLATSGMVVAGSLGAITLILHGILTAAEGNYPAFERIADLLPRLWLHVGAWWLLLAGLVIADRPHLVTIPATRTWVARQLALVLLTVGGPVALGNLGPAAALAPLAGAVAVLVIAWRRRPRLFSMAPREPLAAITTTGSTLAADRLPPWRRLPIWLVIALATGKHPALQLILPPFIVGIGLMISNFFPTYKDTEFLGIIMIPIAAYSIFAVTSEPVRRLGLFDYLPISRRRLMSYLVVPHLTLMIIGYVGGEILAAARPPVGEPLSFGTEADAYGVRLWPRYFSVAWNGAVPPQTMPDGEVIDPPGDYPVLGADGPVVYKPYHTPLGASIDVCAWQLERASARIFGEAIPAAEFRDRYLVDTPEGVVGLRAEGMELLRDHPDLRPRGFPGVPPLQALAIGLLYLVSYGLYLKVFRPGRTERQHRAAYFVGLAVLMGLHLLPFFLTIGGHMDFDYFSIAVLAFSDQLVQALPGDVWGLWAITIAILALGYRLALQQFRRAEWPPVREDDAA